MLLTMESVGTVLVLLHKGPALHFLQVDHDHGDDDNDHGDGDNDHGDYDNYHGDGDDI